VGKPRRCVACDDRRPARDAENPLPLLHLTHLTTADTLRTTTTTTASLIFSIHCQQNGPNRFATGGGDNNVRVWSLASALDVSKETSSAPNLLATLTDHNGQVNIVRFAPHASMLASGSDDCTAAIYELHDGPGGGVLGGEVNVENWRTKFLLRGHSSNVVDMSWSPDGSLLATASLDNSVIVWDATTGKPVKTISHHTSFVKGVAFDPVGTYLATFSDDKSVVIWKRDDWSMVGVITHPFRQMVSTTFALRLSWSPDGQYIMAGNSPQGSTHVAVAVPRGKWDDKEDYLLICGHRGVVASPAFSPRLYHVPPPSGGSPSESLTSVFSLGAYDGKVSVWAASAERAYFVGKRFFSAQVLDVAWTPDGRSVLACSADKSVACFQFEESELGPVATKAEMADVMKRLYGSASGRLDRGKRLLLESADQLALERQQSKETAVNGAGGAPPNSAIRTLDARLGGGSVGFGGAGKSINGGTALNAGLNGVQRMQQNFSQAASGAATGSPNLARASPPSSSPQKRKREGAPSSRVALAALPALRANASVSCSWQLEGSSTSANDVPSLIDGMRRGKVVLTATNNACKVAQSNFSQVTVVGPDGTWTDLVHGSVVAAVGARNFCAVATADGHVLVYSPGGRRRSSPLCVGSGFAKLVKSATRNAIAAVSTSGTIRVIDCVDMRQLGRFELGPILEGTRTLVHVSLSSSSSSQNTPLVTMSDNSAYVWDSETQCWMQVMDASSVISDFYPPVGLSNENFGEVTNLQSKARPIAQAALIGTSNKSSNARYHVSRSHIEGNLAAAVAVGSTNEVARFLHSYAQLLVDSQDELRLKELADELVEGRLTGNEVHDRKLLKDSVMPPMVDSRNHAKLVQRCQDILDELA